MSEVKNQKLAHEPIGKLLFKLALPTVLAQIINLFYNIIDRMYIGRIPGSGSFALAGVGVAFPIIILISAFASLIGMGGAPRAAIMMGEDDKETAEKVLGNSVVFLILMSIVLTIVFYLTKNDILLLFGASENTLPYASSYLGIYLIGTVFVQAALGLNQFISCQGFAKISMATVLIGAVLNIILDPIFIFGFDMGVSGAALATVISQGISALWVFVFLCSKKTFLRIKMKNLRLEAHILLPVIALGLAPFIMVSTECLVQLTFNTGMAKYGTDQHVSIMAVLFSIMQFVSLPMQGLVQGAQPIISYNYGARNIGRVKRAFRLVFTTSLLYSLAIITIIELFPQFFIGLFSPDAEIIRLGSSGLRIFLFGIAIYGAQISCQHTFVALGQAKISMFLALLRKVILLIPLALILPTIGGLGTAGLYLSEPIADILATIITTGIFFLNFNKILTKAPIR